MWALRMWWPSSIVCWRFSFPSCLDNIKAKSAWPLLYTQRFGYIFLLSQLPFVSRLLIILCSNYFDRRSCTLVHKESHCSLHQLSKRATLWRRGDTASEYHPCVSPGRHASQKNSTQKQMWQFTQRGLPVKLLLTINPAKLSNLCWKSFHSSSPFTAPAFSALNICSSVSGCRDARATFSTGSTRSKTSLSGKLWRHISRYT